MKGKSKRKIEENKIKIEERHIFIAFHKYTEEVFVLDYNYFVKIYLPREIGVSSLSEYKMLENYINCNKDLFDVIKNACDVTVNAGAKQNTIQYIKEFGTDKTKKVIINIIGDKTENKEENQ